MKRSKAVLLFMVFVLAFSTLLAACSGKDANEGKETPDNSNTPGDAQALPDWAKEKFTLKFAGWDNNELDAKMIQAFMDKYPNVTVVKDESIVWPWGESLTNAASTNSLPDVFWMEFATPAVANEWLLDLTPYWDKDPETQKIYPNIAEQGIYNGKRFVSPTFQFIMGVFLNKTLFENNNIELPSHNWSIPEMVEVAKKLSNPQEHYYGIGGAWGNLAFEEHWPMANDASVGYNTFDGDKFNFTSQAWIDAYNAKLELKRLKVEEQMTGEEKIEAFGDEGAWPFQKGHVAMQIDGSWNIAWLPEEMEKSGAGEIDFYPYPGGTAGQRMPVILDFIGVSATTEHPEAAYELMKWMSWSEEGWAKRLEFNKELNLNLDKFPVSDLPDIWEKVQEALPYEGLKAAVELMPQAVPDYNKTLAGMSEISDWLWNESLIFDKINAGEFTPADKAKEIEDKYNEFVQKGRQSLGK